MRKSTKTQRLLFALGALSLMAAGCPDENGDGTDPGGCPGGAAFCLNENADIQVIYDGIIKSAGQSLPVNLGSVDPGAETVAGLITVNNIGTADSVLRITDIQVTGLPEGTFRVEDQDGAALPTAAAPWELTSINNPAGFTQKTLRLVMVRPSGDEQVSGSITFVSNDVDEADRSLTFPITADDLAPQITVSPTIVDFGNVAQDSNETKDVTITNVGNADLVVTSFALTGETSFRLLLEGQAFDAKQTQEIVQFLEPLVVAPGTNTVVKVQFAPEGPEEAEATLAFFTNDPDENPDNGTIVSLQANKGGPCIAITPQKAQFGGKLIGAQATLDVEIVSCGDAPVTISELRLLNDSEKPDVTLSTDFGLELGNLKNAEPGTTALTPDDAPLTLDVNETATFQVTFIPDSENPKDADGKPIMDLSFIKIVSNTFVPDREVEVSGFGVTEVCPTAIIKVQEGEEVIPQTKLHLIGSQSFAGTGAISKYEWSVTSPPGSVSVFLPSAAAPDPTFEVNVAGTYVYKLRVWDDKNVQSCLDAEFTVLVVPDEAIHVELLWETPNDPDETDTGPEAGSDLDLHFTHQFAVGTTDVDGDGENEPWFHSFYDCFWFNGNPNWGSFDPFVDDDPGLDRDDTDGAGPENMNLNIPENGLTYKVGVHYWNDHGFGLTNATVRIYIQSVLVFQVEGVELVANDLWEVATVDWPSGAVTPITDTGGGYKIMNNFPNPIFPSN